MWGTGRGEKGTGRSGCGEVGGVGGVKGQVFCLLFGVGVGVGVQCSQTSIPVTV